jgi:hypothetical protein
MRHLAHLSFALLVLMSFQVGAEEPPAGWTYEWKATDFSKTIVSFDEIMSGGPPKDGIPAIDRPVFAPAGSITDIGAQEPVITVREGGAVKAYPVRILMWHEIVNDTVGGVPVAVTFCPLCNSSIVFDRRVGERVLSFGTTGKLRNSDLVMYDRQTESWWQQFTGEAIIGEMVGQRLTPLASRVESFERFLASAGADAPIMVPSGQFARSYGANPYSMYDSSERPFLYRGDLPDEVAPLSRVVVVGEEAWSIDLLREIKRVEKGDLVITWEAGQNSALDKSLIKLGRDVGNVVVQRQTADGLADAPHDISFAFAFFNDTATTEIYTAIE